MTVAIITGGSAGIGRSAALQIAARGAGVILTYRTHPEDALETVAEIEKDGGTAVALPLDVGSVETFPDFAAAVAQALAEHWQTDTFDYLVNNAGFGQMSMFEDTTEALFDRMMQVTLKGPYFLTQALLPMLADGGAIVNTTSSSGVATAGLEAGYSAYASMKGGLSVLTRYLAKELAPRGIRANAVAPGPTRTRISYDAFSDHPEVIPPIVARTALGRLGEPDDVGAVIATLLSDDSRWITAQEIQVSGGYDL